MRTPAHFLLLPAPVAACKLSEQEEKRLEKFLDTWDFQYLRHDGDYRLAPHNKVPGSPETGLQYGAPTGLQ